MVEHEGVSEHEEFLTWVHTVLRDAEVAIHNGDAAPRRAIWSCNDPVTVLGAWKNASGQAELDELFAQLAESFSDCTSYDFELLEAEVLGEVAYTVGLEHTRRRSTGSRGPTPCEQRRSTDVKTANGRWRTDTAARRQTDRLDPRPACL